MGPWNPTFRKGRETWGTPFSWSGPEGPGAPPARSRFLHSAVADAPAPAGMTKVGEGGDASSGRNDKAFIGVQMFFPLEGFRRYTFGPEGSLMFRARIVVAVFI